LTFVLTRQDKPNRPLLVNIQAYSIQHTHTINQRPTTNIPNQTQMSDPKSIVAQAYDSLADWYLAWIDHQPSPRERYANKVLENTPSTSPTTKPYILELGCGPGVPITRLLLSRGARVLANDISPNQITLAKSQLTTPNNNKNIEYITSDMTLLSIRPSTLDGVVCFFTLFHLPRSEQKTMLSKILLWLKPGGLLVINFATVDEEEIYGEMMGRGIFWSSFPVELNRAMVEEVGFEVEVEEVLASEADGGNEFQWMAARKGKGKVLVGSGEVKL
jgi:ubiquinone/menaquinone biosynthesis C-methylase UbiE